MAAVDSPAGKQNRTKPALYSLTKACCTKQLTSQSPYQNDDFSNDFGNETFEVFRITISKSLRYLASFEIPLFYFNAEKVSRELCSLAIEHLDQSNIIRFVGNTLQHSCTLPPSLSKALCGAFEKYLSPMVAQLRHKSRSPVHGACAFAVISGRSRLW